MNVEWLMQPATLYLLLGAGASLGLWLFVSMKTEAVHQGQDLAVKLQALDRKVREVESRLVQAKTSAPAPAPRPRLEVPAPETFDPASLPASGINLTRRSQALRMHRHGESADRIAAALNMPANEVDLLLKVHSILTENLN